MRKINKKFIITFLGVLLLSIVCFSGITMMFADERNGAGDFASATDAVSLSDTLQTNIKGADSPTTTPSSIIDWIIDFSNSNDGRDPIYHIVEIYSGSSPSSLSTMVGKDGIFEKLVLDGHKSENFTPDFKAGNIDYQSFSNGDSEDDIVDAISKADLIYVSEDPDDEWDENNDITEKVMDAIKVFALNKNRPLIIDSHNLTERLKLRGFNKFSDIITYCYNPEGSNYYTFPWKHDKNIEETMNTANASANFKAVDGDLLKAGSATNPNFGWNKVSYREVLEVDDPATTDVDETKIVVHDYGVRDNGETYLGVSEKDDEKGVTYVGPDYVGRVLTIHNSKISTDDSFLTDQLKACCSTAYSFTFTDKTTEGTTNTIDKTVAAKGTFTADGDVKILDEDSDLYKYGYYGRNARPNALKFESLDLNDSTDFTTLESLDFTQYDFVIIEATTKDVDIKGKDAFVNSFKDAMTNGSHILYDGNISSSSGNINSQAVMTAKVFPQLYTAVATAQDKAKFDRVLVTARVYFDDYSRATDKNQVKDIADIINAGYFRTVTGKNSGDSSNVYTVLEIEPSYPIDMVLASYLKPVKDYTYTTTKIDDSGNASQVSVKYQDGSQLSHYYTLYTDKYYYMNTNSVSEDTPDEISYGTNKSLTSLLEDTTTLKSLISQENVVNVTDYYKWALSEAKIKHATGKKEVQVIHMSAVEFASSRKSLMDNYDAIYIGGDHSGIKNAEDWYTTTLGGHAYDMYFHNGDMYDYDNTFNEKTGQYGVFAGNDLTLNKYRELVKYAKKMPVIISSDVCDAFKKLKSNQNQTELDPQSRMFKFIDGVLELDSSNNVVTKSSYKDYVLCNFDPEYTYKVNNPKTGDNAYPYGSKTVEAFATVFHGQAEEPSDAYNPTQAKSDYVQNKVGEKELSALLQTERPRLVAVLTNGTSYGGTDDKASWIDPESIKGKGLEWKVQVSMDAKVNLYIDDNSDGKFSSDELIESKPATKDKEITLNFTPQSDYYGVVYWKIIAIEKSNSTTTDKDEEVLLSSSTTGCCKIKRTTQSKMYVNLLQIMPIKTRNGKTLEQCKYPTDGQNEHSANTLFLCKECQLTKAVQRGNRYTTLGLYYEGVLGGQNTTYNSDISCLGSTDNIEKILAKFEPGYNYVGYNNGWHTHDFGIAKYDSSLAIDTNETGTKTTNPDRIGIDDIGTNWFDDIRDDYDVDTTIIYADDFENKVARVKNAYAGLSDQEIKDEIGAKGGPKEKSNTYQKYYLAMKAVINGTVEDYVDKDTGDPLKFVTVDSSGNATVNLTLIDNTFVTTPKFSEAMSSNGISAAMLNSYASASYKLDNILNTGTFNCNKSYGHWDDIKGYCTDANIPRDKRKYYDIYCCTGDFGSNRIPTEYNNQYEIWRDANILKNFFFEQNQRNLWLSSYDVDSKTVKLSDIYTCVCIGAAENFADDDINVTGCDALLKYIDDDGNLILFHDTLSSNVNATSTMTAKLSTAFGMNGRNIKSEETTVIKLYMAADYNEMTNGNPVIVNIPCNADVVSLTYTLNGNWNAWGGSGPVASITTPNNSGAVHNIRINFNGNTSCYIAIGDKDSNRQTVNGNGSITVSSSLGVSSYNPSFTPDETYYMSDLPAGKSISPRMLSFKGKYITFPKGYNGAEKTTMHKFTGYNYQTEEGGLNNTQLGTKHMANMIRSANNAEAYPTDRAKQNNVGIITMYPFPIASDINIGATAPGGYALDIEDDNLVVYYSLVGGSQGSASTLFAGDPKDGINNYFLYQLGSITYTGAGHGLLTGYGRQNNWERKLFINCIVNAGKKSSRGPAVTLHDLNTTLDKVQTNEANKKIIEFNGDDCDYYTEIEDVNDFKGLDFLPHIPMGNKLTHVLVWYDVNHTEDGADGKYQMDTGVDTKIFEWDSTDNASDTSVGDNILKALDKADLSSVALMDDYFDAGKNKDYAYIIVQVTDKSKPGQKASATLRIQYKQSLIDLN